MKKTGVGFALLGAVLAASFSGPLIKLALLDGVPPAVVAFYRLSFAVLLLLPSFGVNPAVRRQIRTLTKSEWFLLLASGFFLAMHFYCWMGSLQYVTTFGSTVLVSMQPIFVVLGSSLFFGERTSLLSVLGVLISMAGAAAIGLADHKGGGDTLFGDFLAFSGSFFAAGYILCGRKLRTRLSTTAYTFFVYGICTLFLFLAVIVSRGPLYPYGVRDFLIFLALTVFCTLLGHSVFNWALRHVRAPVVSVALLGEPIGAAVWAFFLFREIPGPGVVAGGMMILLGMAVFLLWDIRRKDAG